MCQFTMTPLQVGPLQAAPVLNCVAPLGWGCSINGITGGAEWHAASPTACIGQFTTLDRIRFTTSVINACYRVDYAGMFPGSSSSHVVCFRCDATVDRAPASWGQMKLLYR